MKIKCRPVDQKIIKRMISNAKIINFPIIAYEIVNSRLGSATPRVRHSQDQPLPGAATSWVRHSQGEPLYSVSEHFINPTSVSANHYYFNQFQLLLAL